MDHKSTYAEDANAHWLILFQHGFVIDQSAESYLILLDLLKKTQALASTKTGRDKEIVQYLFDGFAYILLNNMQALYESERAYL